MTMQVDKKQIFICWSGDYSKKIAPKIKDLLMNCIFKDKGLNCFVSEEDIASGEDWWSKITKELNASKMGILILTKDNVSAPWIHFEAGALISNKVKVIPLLFHCNVKVLEGTPLSQKQAVSFGDENQFAKMIIDINKQMKLQMIEDEMLKIYAIEKYKEFRKNEENKKLFDDLKSIGVFDASYIYPSEVKNIERGSLFISAPMATLNDEEYSKQNEFLIQLVDMLKNPPFSFKNITCPAWKIPSPENFDGGDKSIHDNFVALKKVDCSIVIYIAPKPSSTLIELGYDLALSKNTIVFYRGDVPYLIDRLGENVEHVKTCRFNNYDNIIEYLSKNGKTVFSQYE